MSESATSTHVLNDSANLNDLFSTVIFAGRLREAKRERKAAAERVFAGKSAKFGESLRMSNAGAGTSGKALPEKNIRDVILDEEEEDWVQMRIFEGLSHGVCLLPSAEIRSSGADSLDSWFP